MASGFLEARLSHGRRVLTAWPTSDEIKRGRWGLGYVTRPDERGAQSRKFLVGRKCFSPRRGSFSFGGPFPRSNYEVRFYIFLNENTKPRTGVLGTIWQRWTELKTRFPFGFHRGESGRPAAAAGILGGSTFPVFSEQPAGTVGLR